MNNRISNTSQFLLNLFSDMDFFFTNGRQYMGYGRSIEDMRKLKSAVERRELNRALFEAKRQKLIRLKKDGNRIISYLTRKGAVMFLKNKMMNNNKKLPVGQICFVIFDIPEDIKRVRNAFRNLLKEVGFRMTQRSVWEGDLDVIDDLRSLVEVIGAEKYIRIYHALDIR